jgi:membrane-associated protease RseP (regulator of RpoE activity)
MRKIFIIPIVIAILFYGCVRTLATPQSTNPEAIVEAFWQAGDIATCLKFVADDVVFRQEPPGIEIKGKIQLEAMLKDSIAWHRQYSITSPFNSDDGKVTFSAKMSGDDLLIIGLDYMALNYEFHIRNGKIKSWLTIPNPEDWKKITGLTAGGVGIKFFEAVKQGIRVKELVENSPAYEAGMRVGDIIIAVNGVNCSEMTRPGEIQLRIKGPIGSKVVLTVIHEGMAAPIDIEITRVDLTKLHYQ